MNHTIQLTAEQFKALQSGQPITIEPPKTKWEPIGGQFLVQANLVGTTLITNVHNSYSISGLRYQTKSQADSAAKAIRTYARQLAWLEENDDGWIADWSDADQKKYYVMYSQDRAEFETTYCYQSNYLSTIFMSEPNATKLAQLMNDGIVEF